LSPELGEVFKRDANNIIVASRQQPQQAKASLMSNDIEILVDTVTVRVIGR
jgi:ribosomal protein S12 methylthiotransferase accessory factor YcaO